jgi:hypothetical protein
MLWAWRAATKALAAFALIVVVDVALKSSVEAKL